jgi:ketosteroid isomerase-like protein
MPRATIPAPMFLGRRMALPFSLVLLSAYWLAPHLPAQALSAPQAGMHRAEKHESRHEIDQLEETWRKAILNADISALDALLADDYMAITASGTLQTREETLNRLRSGRLHFSTLDLFDCKVRFYGTTALVTSRATVIGTSPDGPMEGNFRYTRVYVRNKTGVWKIVSFEASRIREAGSKTPPSR